MTQDAIQPDAPELEPDSAAPTPEPAHLSRLALMEQVASSHEANVNKDSVAGDIDDIDAAALADAAASPEPPAPAPQQATPEQLVTVKVDGEERQMPLAEVLRGYQKDQAASRRLEEVNRRTREIELREAQLLAREQTSAPQPAIPNTPSPTNADAEKGFLDSLYLGDESKTREALTKMMEERWRHDIPATPDLTTLASQLVPAIKQQIDLESASTAFAKDFQDIVSDPYLAQRADAFLNAELAQGIPLAEAMPKAGRATRDWVKTIAGVPLAESQPSTTARAEKLARKQAIDNPPATSVSSAAPAPLAENHTDVIKEMRRARGLPA